MEPLAKGLGFLKWNAYHSTRDMLHQRIIFNTHGNVGASFNREKINVEVAKMAMTPLERKALFKSAVTLREITMQQAADELGVSYNHLMLVLRGDRVASERLEHDIADFVGRPVRDMFQTTRGTGRPRTGGKS
jgi:hypothetical protein